MRSWRALLARALILVEITRIARACSRIPEQKEAESVYHYLRGSAYGTDKKKDDESSRHLAHDASLPALRSRSRPAAWFRGRPRCWPGDRRVRAGEVLR